VLSVFLYGADCWTLRKEDKHRILTAEMARLRKLATVITRQEEE